MENLSVQIINELLTILTKKDIYIGSDLMGKITIYMEGLKKNRQLRMNLNIEKLDTSETF